MQGYIPVTPEEQARLHKEFTRFRHTWERFQVMLKENKLTRTAGMWRGTTIHCIDLGDPKARMKLYHLVCEQFPELMVIRETKSTVTFTLIPEKE